MNRPVRILAAALATTLGTGFFPFGPGTVGSLAAAALFIAVPDHFHLPLLPAILAVAWAGCAAGRRMWGEDPSRVTIDEVAGCWIACLAAPPEWGIWGVAAAFFLFRVFDIVKPWPVSVLDRMKSSAGILLDDVAAGALSAAVLLAAALVT